MDLHRQTRTLRPHPQAERVPGMDAREYAALLAGITANGVLQPLEITAEGVVLDGHHRLRAASELGLKRVPVRIVAPDDPLAHMLLGTLQRRHLDPGRKAAAAVDLLDLEHACDQGIARRRGNLKHHQTADASTPAGRSRDRAALLAGVSPRLVQDALTLKRGAPNLFDRVRAGELPLKQALRQLKQAERYATIHPPGPLPDGTFGLTYGDPPWQLGNPDSDYSPEQYYPTMPLDQICALPVPAADNALLYLWAVSSHLPDALAVIEAWGFEYVGNEVWVKDSIGMGNWTRPRHELLLIGRKGNASPAEPTRRLDSVIEAPRRAHSQKPDLVYQRLEHLYPHLSKLELFARGTPRPGWTAWGNQLNNEAEAA